MSAVGDHRFACRVASQAGGLLRAFNDGGVLDAADVHVAQRLTTLADETDPTVGLAVALAVRAVRGGSVCVDLTRVAEDAGAAELGWPDPVAWLAALRASRLLTDRVLRLYDDRLLYLDRYWREEEQVCADLLALSVQGTASARVPVIERLFPAGFDEQRIAAQIALTQQVTVVTGGPGTGKTTTVARLLALLAEQAELAGQPGPRIALAAPTGKAAARLAEAVAGEVAQFDAADRFRLAGLRATTLHMLLGARHDNAVRFKHHRGNRLPHDVIVVDETSMVSLTMMARLLEAVRPQARLVLVGDPGQLASVDAGAVLADLVDGLSARPDTRVATLRTSHRFGASIDALATAVRSGDADRVIALLQAGGQHLEWVQLDNPIEQGERLRPVLVAHALRIREAALLGDTSAALAGIDEHRLLCAPQAGRYGVRHWNRQVRSWVSEHTGDPLWTEWFAGQPLLVTANDYGLGLHNGDTGVVVARDDGLRAVIAAGAHTPDFAANRLTDVETMFALTIHKSQGSQSDAVTVVLPPVESQLLTRELFYTAVTRAKSTLRIVGSEAAVRAALARRALRASGLAQRLRQAGAAEVLGDPG